MKKINASLFLIPILLAGVLLISTNDANASTEITRPPNQTVKVTKYSVSGPGGSDFSFTAGGGTVPISNKNSIHQWRDATGSAAEWVTPRVLDFGVIAPGETMEEILWKIEIPHTASPGTYIVHWISHCESLPSGNPCGSVTDYKYTIIVEEKVGGCLIATATFGTELAPQVQSLREIRDNTLLATSSGNSFMTGFNAIYYSFSPAVADLQRENPVFRETVKLTITPLLSSLSLLNYVDIDSEAEMLGYGISIIILNIGMYFVIPAVLIYRIRKKIGFN